MSELTENIPYGPRKIVSVAIFFIVVWLLSAVVYLISPIGKPVAEFQLSSSTPGFSQIFYGDEEGAFTERDSRWSPVVQGESTVTFSLVPRFLAGGDAIRWDPLDAPAEIQLAGITFRSGLTTQVVPLDSQRPSLDVSEISLDDAGARFTLQSNDPQILILNAAPGFVATSILIGLGMGLAVAFVATAIMLLVRHRWKSRQFKLGRGVDREPPDSPNSHVPTWALISALVFGFVSIGMLVWGSQIIGVSWDEPIRERALAEFFRSGWLVPRDAFAAGIPDPVAAAVYGPVALLMGHVFVVALTDNPLWTSAISADAYAARHLAVAAMAVLTLAAVALIARRIFGSWRWAALAVATLGSIPLWLGHGYFNIKDVPVAAGFTFFTLALVSLARGAQSAGRPWWNFIAATAGVLLAIGSRPGIWLALAASVVGTIVLLIVLDTRVVGLRAAGIDIASRLGPIVGGSLTGFGLLWLIYPLVFGNPLQLLRGSASSSQSFSAGGNDTLTAGVFLPTSAPWTYVPVWLSAQLPLMIAIAAVVGTVWMLTDYVRSVVSARRGDALVRSSIPLALQATVVPLGAIVLGATLYGGVRQLLFIFPAIALLAVIGIHRTVSWVRSTKREWLVQVAWVVVVIGLAIPLVSQLRLFPYNFAYFNAAASVGDIDQNWEVDGWWLSGRELVEGEQFPARTICVDSESRFISSCSRMEMVTPFLGELGGGDIVLEEDQYVALSRFPYNVGRDTCVPFREVTRGLYFQEIQLSHADICTSTLVALPEQGVSFAGLTKEDSVLLWGWNPYLLWGWGEPDADGVWMVEPEASIGFTVPVSSGDRTVEITGTGSPLVGEGASLRVFVNGIDAGTIPLPGAGQVQTSSVAVPQEAWTALDDGRVVVRLQAEGVDPSALKSAIDIGEPGLYRIESLRIP